MQKKLQNIYLIFLLLAPLKIVAQKTEDYFNIKHPTCTLRIDKKDLEFSKEWFEGLEKKGFKIKPYLENNRLYPQDLYAKMYTKRLKGKIYKDCLANVEILLANRDKPTSKDKVLASRKSKRSLPRITFNGNERCTRAIKDALVHIPNCLRSIR